MELQLLSVDCRIIIPQAFSFHCNCIASKFQGDLLINLQPTHYLLDCQSVIFKSWLTGLPLSRHALDSFVNSIIVDPRYEI